MKLNLRWQLLLAVIAFSLVLSLISFQAQAVRLCSVPVPASGGTFTEGFLGAPRYLNPLLSDNYPVDREIVGLLFDGLTYYDDQGRLQPSLARDWEVSEDGLTFRFTLHQNITWHDGEDFTAEDVAFSYGLLQKDDFPAPQALRQLWQSVTINQLAPDTIEFTLTQPYGPFLQATTRGILPEHLYREIPPAQMGEARYNTTPVGTGPFMVSPGQDWRSSGRLRLSPNPVFWRQGLRISGIEFRFFPDEESRVAAFQAGEIQAINALSPSWLPDVASLPGVRLFTAASPRLSTLFFNLTDSGSPALNSLAVRQSLAYGLDRERMIDDVLNGQGIALEGPFPTSTWAYNPQLMTPYHFEPITATLLLEAAGWLLPEGKQVREQEGEPLRLRLVSLDEPDQRFLAEFITDQWAKIGVAVDLNLAADVDTLRQSLSSRDFDVAIVDVLQTGDPDLYDFWSQEAIIRGQNYAGWNRRRASEALESGRKLWAVDDRRSYYDAFLSFYDSDLPALTLFQYVTTYALSGDVKQAEINPIGRPRDRYETISEWFLLYRDVTVACPSTDS